MEKPFLKLIILTISSLILFSDCSKKNLDNSDDTSSILVTLASLNNEKFSSSSQEIVTSETASTNTEVTTEVSDEVASDEKSDSIQISSIKLNDISLDNFSNEINEYTVNYNLRTNSLNFEIVLEDSNTVISLNGGTSFTGQLNQTENLKIRENTFDFKIISESGNYTKTVTITVNRIFEKN